MTKATPPTPITKTLRYKILIPVLAQVEEFRRLLTQIPDKSSLIIVNNLDNQEVGRLCDGLPEAQIHHYPGNLGCAASWNIGLRQLEQGLVDYLIILSPSCNWTNSVVDFIELIEQEEQRQPQDFYQAVGNFVTDTHAFALTKQGVDKIGLFDENFHPVYFEDTDYCYRQKLLGSVRKLLYPPRTSQALNLGVKNDPRVYQQYLRSAQRIHDYYVAKWGGDYTQETFTHPFNNPQLSLKDWTLRFSELIPLPGKDLA